MADTPFHIQGDELCQDGSLMSDKGQQDAVVIYITTNSYS